MICHLVLAKNGLLGGNCGAYSSPRIPRLRPTKIIRNIMGINFFCKYIGAVGIAIPTRDESRARALKLF